MKISADLRQGMVDISPMLLAYIPISALWGTVAASHGLSPLEAYLMSVWVYSGAAQFAAMDLGSQGISLLSLLIAVFTLSLRHSLMSASVSRHMESFSRSKASVLLFWLTDEAWALIERRALSHKISPSYFIGVALPLWLCWTLFSALGAWLGNAVGNTAAIGLDFAFAAMFIAVVAGFWKGASTAAVLIASATAAVVAKLYLPGAWYILAGGGAGMLVALLAYRDVKEVQPDAI